jgi:hypothetical protein
VARKKKQLISHVGQHMDEHAVVTKAIFGVNTSGCQGERTNHVSIESVIFGTYITYIYIFMYILCVYHSSQVLPRVFVIKLLRWIISRCILSFWPTIWESIGISIWLLPEPLEIYIYTSDPWKETTTDHTSPSHALTLWEILPTHSTNLLVMYVHHFWITFFTCNQLSIPQIWATPVASGGYLPREAAARQKPCFSPMIFNKRWNSSNLSFIRAVLL